MALRRLVGAEVAVRRRKNRILAVVIGGAFTAGLAVAGAFWRHQVTALVRRARPYRRRSSHVQSPVLIINRWSGDGKAEKYGLAAAAKKMGVRTVMLEKGDDLIELANNAISSGADAIGMAGGDGSPGLVAGVAVERGVPFFCAPVGTRNHFALNLGLDRDDPLSALSALEDGEEILTDYATAGGRPFLNNVSFGIYAQAVHRDEYRAEKAATLKDSITKAAADVNEQAALRYPTPDGRTHDRAPLLLVANNVYRYSGYPVRAAAEETGISTTWARKLLRDHRSLPSLAAIQREGAMTVSGAGSYRWWPFRSSSASPRTRRSRTQRAV